MRWREGMLAVLYGVLAVATALILVVGGAVDCYEECRYDVPNPRWPYDIDAWQWDAIFWLGVASAAVAVAFLVAVFFRGPRVAAVAAALQLGFVIAGGLFERAAGNASFGLIAFVVAAVAAPAVALLALRARRASSRAGEQGTRAGPRA